MKRGVGSLLFSDTPFHFFYMIFIFCSSQVMIPALFIDLLRILLFTTSQDLFNLRNRLLLFSQLTDLCYSFQTLNSAVPSGQILFCLIERQHSFLCVKLQSTVAHCRKPYKFSDCHIFCLLYYFHASLS